MQQFCNVNFCEGNVIFVMMGRGGRGGGGWNEVLPFSL